MVVGSGLKIHKVSVQIWLVGVMFSNFFNGYDLFGFVSVLERFIGWDDWCVKSCISLSSEWIAFIPELFFLGIIVIIWCYLSIDGSKFIAFNSLKFGLIGLLFVYSVVLTWRIDIGNVNTIIDNSNFVCYSKILIVIFAIPILWLKGVNEQLALYFSAIVVFNLGLIGSADILTTYVCLEGLSLLSYGVVALNKTIGTAEAGLKYFLYGISASALFVFGLSLLYIQSGELSWNGIYFWNISLTIDQINGTLIAILLVLIALIYKLSLFPFHFTLPDVYEGSSWQVIAVINLGVKLGVALFLFKIWGVFIANEIISEYLSLIFLWFAIISIIGGCFGAIMQTSLRRFFAYTSINQSGFMLLGLLTNSVFGLEASLLYIVVYMIAMLLFFYTIVVNPVVGDELIGINKLVGFWKVAAVSALFSMAGIPPLFGFGSKYVLWLSLFDSWSSGILSQLHNSFIIISLVISIFISLISAFYYLRLIKISAFQIPIWLIDTKGYQVGVDVVSILLYVLILWPLAIGVILAGFNSYATQNYGGWIAYLF